MTLTIEQIIILSLGALCAIFSLFGYFIFRHLKLRKNVFIESVGLPIYGLIWYLFVVFILDQVHVLQRYTLYLIEVGFISTLILSLYRLIGGLETRFINGQYLFSHVDLTSVRAISRISRVTLTIFAILLLLPVFHIPVSGILAFGGAAGVGISFAAKDLLANFFGGFTVMLDRPFSLGDKIRSIDQNFEGYVEHIGWRSTRIRTEDKRPLYIPNASFLTIAIENISKAISKRIEKSFLVDPRKMDNIRAAVQELTGQLKKHAGVDQKELISVHLTLLTQIAPQVKLICYTKRVDQAEYEALVQDLLLLAMSTFQQNGVDLLFNPLGFSAS
ncbi:MAG: mechanosensitive ion channel family protein [Chlamydiia bacterium]